APGGRGCAGRGALGGRGCAGGGAPGGRRARIRGPVGAGAFWATGTARSSRAATPSVLSRTGPSRTGPERARAQPDRTRAGQGPEPDRTWVGLGSVRGSLPWRLEVIQWVRPEHPGTEPVLLLQPEQVAAATLGHDRGHHRLRVGAGRRWWGDIPEQVPAQRRPGSRATGGGEDVRTGQELPHRDGEGVGDDADVGVHRPTGEMWRHLRGWRQGEADPLT